MNLYWATTPNGFENWFVIAKSEKTAARFHELAEGFNRHEAKAKFVCEIAEGLIKKYKLVKAKWPCHELIEDLGGKFDTEDNPRVVNLNGTVYVEGTFTEAIFFHEIGETEGLYIIKIQNTEKYKIGITKDIKRRIKQFETGNPLNIKLLYFMATKHSRSLEKHLHEVFKKFRTKGEWFNFNDEVINEIEIVLSYITTQSNEFVFYNIKSASDLGRVF
jgi:Meiotically up-regulated gene 113